MNRRTAIALFTFPVLLLSAVTPASGMLTPQILSPEVAYAYYKTAYTNTAGLLESVPFTSTENVYSSTGRVQGQRILTVDSAGNSMYADTSTGTNIRRGSYQYISIVSHELSDNYSLLATLAKSKRAKYLRAPIDANVIPAAKPLSAYAVDALETDISSMTAGEVSFTTTATGSVLSWPARGDSKLWEGTYQVTIKKDLIVDSRLVSPKNKAIYSFTYKINPSPVRAPSGPFVEWSTVISSPEYKPLG